ncbi:hypothetical protein D3C76_1107440 [compost metagenome]
MVDTPRPQAPLGDFETTALAENHVLIRHSYVLEQDFGMAMRRIVITKHRQRANDFHPRRIGGHQHHRMLLVAWPFRVGQAHEDHHLAARVAGAGGPPLAAIDHPLVTVTHSGGGHVGGVRRGDVRLGHGERRTDLAAQQWLQPLALLRFAAIAHQHLHVAGVRRRTVERLWPKQRAAHDFRQRGVFQVAQAGAVFRLGQEQVPQPFGAGLGLELFHDRGGLPAVALGDLTLEHRFGGVDIGVHERADALAQCLDLGRIGEIHRGYLHGSEYMGRA